jgi:predicted DNA-binding transcriptional regulator AlpA
MKNIVEFSPRTNPARLRRSTDLAGSPRPAGPADRKHYLNSWKEVAHYVGRSERTIQRWEKNLGLPIHRPAGKLRSSVIAVADEIDEWIRNTPARSIAA